MPYTEKFTIAFLKDMALKIECVLKDAEIISATVERLHKDYMQFIEDNPETSHLEAFKTLEKDLRILCQVCRFVPSDCKDVRHSIAEAGASVVSIN